MITTLNAAVSRVKGEHLALVSHPSAPRTLFVLSYYLNSLINSRYTADFLLCMTTTC